MLNETNIVAPRVPLIDERTGLISREWYRFFLNLFVLTGSGANATSLLDLQVGPPAVTVDLINHTVNKTTENLSPSQDGLLAQIAELQKQTEALALQRQPELGTLSGIQQDDVPWLKFHNEPVPTPVGTGSVFWNGGYTLNLVMTPNVNQAIGESQYYYIKASAAIAKGDLVMFDGAVGASGVLKGKPSTGVTNGQLIMGVAAEAIALNGFGLVSSFGLVRGFDTTGTPYGEVWVDGDILYYNPSFAGGLTKTQPTAPIPHIVVAAVVNAASAGSGSIFVRVQAEPLISQLSDVYFGGAGAVNYDILMYNETQQRWENVPGVTRAKGRFVYG